MRVVEKVFWIGFGAWAGLPVAALAEDEVLSGEVGVLWESRYVLEGRDVLDGEGIVGLTAAVDLGLLVGGVWHGSGTAGEYGETHVFLEREVAFGPLTVRGGVTWLWFEPDQVDDWEVSGGLGWDVGAGFSVSADGVYSFGAPGAFYEVGGAFAVPGLPDGVELAAVGVLGINQGYVADGHDGVNHVQMGLELAVAVTERVELVGYVAHTWGLEVEPGDGLEDFFWGGLGVAVRF